MSLPRLRFEDLTGGYGSTTIVRDLAGAAIAGEALCVLGRNGVGKTTLMKLLTGYLPCVRGRVLLDEQPITALDPAARRRAGVSYCPQERPVFDDLSVRENLTLMRDSRKLAPFRRYFDRFPILERRLNQHAGTLSGGEKKMLSFSGMAILTNRLVISIRFRSCGNEIVVSSHSAPSATIRSVIRSATASLVRAITEALVAVDRDPNRVRSTSWIRPER